MTKWLTVLMTAAVLAFSGLLSSCRTPSSGITVESYPKTQITVNSKMVGTRLNVLEYNARKENDLLQVQITAENVSKKDCQFEYRFEWKEKDGMVIDTPMTTWVPISLSSKEKAGMKAVAPAAKAEDFTFIVRFSRPSTRW